ncbi:MAG: hypothetical protein HY925_14830, partial [Elusimicrobia bacterium]|nr:hypothetical protein [Elusimicrobiota bacterium]
SQGNHGSGVGLFVLVGLSELGWALVLPTALILRALKLDSILSVGLVLMIAGVFNMRLKARSVRHIYGLSATKAWGLLMLPYIGSFLFFAAIGAAVLVSAAVSIVKLFH